MREMFLVFLRLGSETWDPPCGPDLTRWLAQQGGGAWLLLHMDTVRFGLR